MFLKGCVVFILSLLFMNSEAFEITFQESIEIESSLEEVFSFAADASNDDLWRSEVHSIKANGPFLKGTLYVEDAFLGFHYHYITRVELIDLEAPHLALYETTTNNPYRLQSERVFKAITQSKTLFTYKVYVEEALIYDVLFENFPIKWAKKSYKAMMREYLKNLKSLLEANPSLTSKQAKLDDCNSLECFL